MGKQSDDQWFVFWCSKCRAQVQLIVDGRYNMMADTEPPEWHVFGHCVRCGSAGVLFSEEIGDFVKTRQVYPAIVQTVDFELPEHVDESYREANKCAAANAPLATAVMVRRTLEAIGRHFDPSAKTLFKALQTMKEKGIISEEFWHWGEQLRFIGNIGAHPGDEKVSPEDARDALEFLNAIVEVIYLLRPKFQAMQQRRTKATP